LAADGADERLYDRLAAAGFDGPEYAMFVAELAAYGIGICEAWLRTGLMFKYCRDRGRPAGPPPAIWSAEDRHELVLETVAVALRDFHDHALMKGQWRADGGASLKTYFIGACLHAFPNVFRKWRTERRQWDQAETAAAPLSGSGDLADQVATSLDLRQRLAGLDQRTRAALVLTEAGYRQEEIAEVLGISARAVEGLLHRHRRRVRQRQDGGGDDDGS
jgi:RNA polymerase sigma factor (sigma-70 family)